MKRTALHIILASGLLALFVILIAPVSTANAQAAGSSGQALEIGPPVLNLTANPGQTIKADIKLRDVSSGSLIVTNQINDFTSSGEGGTPKIILDDTVTPYSLKNWLSPIPQLTLKPREVKNLTISISVPRDASPGGYYGIVRFTGTPPELKDTGVSLSASIGSLILLRVNGDAKENLSVEQFFATKGQNPSTMFEVAPITFVSRIKNTGNLHEQPAGTVTITDMFNKTVATLGVNQPPRDILPQSIRRFESSLDSSNIGNKILFGLYHANLSLSYGSNKQIITSSITFWVIPYTIIGAIIAGLIAAFFGLRYAIRRYNRHVIMSAQKPRRK